jgi:hypothetical protein
MAFNEARRLNSKGDVNDIPNKYRKVTITEKMLYRLHKAKKEQLCYLAYCHLLFLLELSFVNVTTLECTK